MKILDPNISGKILKLKGFSYFDEGIRSVLASVFSPDIIEGSDNKKSPDDISKMTPSKLNNLYQNNAGHGKIAVEDLTSLAWAVRAMNLLKKCTAEELKVNYVFENKTGGYKEFLSEVKNHKAFLDKNAFLHNIDDGSGIVEDLKHLTYKTIFKNLDKVKGVMKANGYDTSFVDRLEHFCKVEKIEVISEPLPLKQIEMIVNIPGFERALEYADKRVKNSFAEFKEHTNVYQESSYRSASGTKTSGPFQELLIIMKGLKASAESALTYNKSLENEMFAPQDRLSYVLDYTKSISDELPKPFNAFINRMSQIVDKGSISKK